MEPSVIKMSQDDQFLKFTLDNINVSLANALRRTVLSDIPIVVFKTFPHDKNKADIKINTSRMNNEILKQRLACIPIHIKDLKFPLEDYVINIKKKNDTETIQIVTTEDFEIIDKNTNKALDKAKRDEIFPPSSLTDDFIDFVRLRPSISDEIDGEEIDIVCTLDVGTAKQDGAYNVVSTCSYAASQDLVKVNDTWTQKLADYKSQGLSKEEIAEEKANWDTLEAKRIIKPDSFDYIIETVGIFSNTSIIYKACHILIDKFEKLVNIFESDDELIKTSNKNMSNCFDIILNNEDYTVGKVLEFIFYKKHYGKILTFCAFNKAHPHDTYSTICLAFEKVTEKSEILTYFTNVCKDAKGIFEKLADNFKED